ncbi:thiol-disulfide oxidoreductase DCC family protein [Aphanothece sacrum]|uniref:Thiol-disulfide oxidoreductase n=1 Tax=Aphanothece sacrum FPU1 TaxID=1920663 RepID=A0A401IMN9_APHSA|nr:DUF393 domain-containing protein [Aphanothece sacrum]GBF82511.1 thiol-disulfide oxidoreductase [Aphanothece sacrum FPU1]GBF85755.1 thiol-disulfide oxidoreductase [Aphanothece sacrum FPU3]
MSTTKTEIIHLIPTWKIKLLYDGECPLCLREIRFLQKQDNQRGLVSLVDIAEQNYHPEEHGGVDYETAMGRIHAILPDGTIAKDIEAFRLVYEVLGLGWVYAITKFPVIEAIANLFYRIWAKLRLPLTRRPNLNILVAQRQQKQQNSRCKLNSCQD